MFQFAKLLLLRSIVSRAHRKWLVSDAMWEKIKLLIPSDNFHSTHSKGRPQISNRALMNGIFYVLRTGCQWRALDVTRICSGATAHEHFQHWARMGVFKSFWKSGLKEYDDSRGVLWKWLALDTAFCKAPVAGSKKVGKNPTDRGKLGIKRSVLTDGRGVPIGIIVAPAHWHDSTLAIETIRSTPIRRPQPTNKHPQHLYLDKGDDADWLRVVLLLFGFTPHIPLIEHREIRSALQKLTLIRKNMKPRRWIVESDHSWFNRFRSILIR